MQRHCICGIAAAALLGAVLATAGADGARKRKPEPPIRGVSVPVSVTVKTDKAVYTSDAPIHITLTVKNPSRSAVRLPFSSGQKYDIEIRRGKGLNGERVWQWAKGRVFTEMLTQATVAPGKSLTFQETFAPNDKTAEGVAPLAPGTYTVVGILTTSGRAPRPSGGTVITVK